MVGVFQQSQKKKLELAALLHDVGKVRVSEDILAKPGKLSDEEYDIVKEHPRIGENIAGEIEYLETAKPFIRHHHEMFNGTGYPDKLSKKDIPLGARIISIAEVYSSLICDVPYRPALKEQEAKDIIRKNSGEMFDPELVNLFLE